MECAWDDDTDGISTGLPPLDPDSLLRLAVTAGGREILQVNRVLSWGTRKQIASFTARDLFRDLRKTFSDRMDNVWPVLDRMCAEDQIRRLPDEKRDGPGRKPSPAFEFVRNRAPKAVVYDEEFPPPSPGALEASLGFDPWCTGCESRRVPGGGLCERCLADEVR